MNNTFLKHEINVICLKSNTFKRISEASYSGEEEVEGFVIDEKKREAGGQGEFSVGLAARRDVVSQPAT
jgi:hypothetical protein